MSTYIPVSTWSIVQRLHREGLILPLPGDGAFLTDEHQRIEKELVSLRDSLAGSYGIDSALVERWVSFFDACVRFTSMTHEATWRLLYGDEFLKETCWAVLGRQLKIELYKPKSFRRRVLLVGPQGSGRPGIGDDLRQLMVECLVRTLSVGDNTRESRSAKLSRGHHSVDTELFGGQRSGAEAKRQGLLDQCAGSVLFLDGALATTEETRRRLLDRIEAADSGLTHDRGSLQGNLHLIVGAAPGDLNDIRDPESVGQSLFQSACRDGRLNIPHIRDVLAEGDRWSVIFPMLFAQVARRYCGVPSTSLHHYGRRDGAYEHPELTDDVVEREQAHFLEWSLQPDRVEAISQAVRTQFDDYEWPGNVREFEALMHRVIESQDTAELDLHEIERVCGDFRMRAPDSRGTSSASRWLTLFRADIPTLPFSHDTLPEVINRVEARYLEEAAKKAAQMRHPKNARLQDVARILGIPRQTATRKWQQHGLAHSLLTRE